MDLFPENEGVVLLRVGDKFSIELGKISNHIPVISSFVESTQDTRYFFPLSILRHICQGCQCKIYSTKSINPQLLLSLKFLTDYKIGTKCSGKSPLLTVTIIILIEWNEENIPDLVQGYF